MIPLRIYAKGFMCFRDPVEMHFDGAPLWMLTGKNGAGKSAVFDAILFALFGIHRKGVQNAHFIINKQSKELVVEFDFLVGNNFFRVKRTLGRKGKPTFQAYEKKGARVEEVSSTGSKENLKEWVIRTIGLDERAFTSSVFLQQGKSEALLEEDTDRHAILSQIVDLSKYQSIQERADEYRKNHKGQADAFQSQLQTIPPVDELAIEALAQEAISATVTLSETRKQLDELIALKVHAQNWNRLTVERARIEREIEEAEYLFDQREQIERRAARGVELSQILPHMRKLFETRKRLAEIDEQIIKLNEEAGRYANAHAQAIVELDKAQAHYDQTYAEQEGLQRAHGATQEVLSQIAPQLVEIEQLRNSRNNLATIDQSLSQFPSELEEKISELEQSLRAINELRSTLPLLHHYVDARSRWVEAQKQEREAGTDLSRLSDKLSAASEMRSEVQSSVNRTLH